MTDYLKLPFATDGGIGSKARVGLVVLATDYTVEQEFRTVFPGEEISLFSSRIANETAITPKTLAAMEPRISQTVATILPGERLDVVAYGCTSASMVLGNERVFERIREVQPDAKCTTPSAAAFSAFKAFGAKRIGVLTPYREDVNNIVRSSIESAGFEVPIFASFEEERDPVVARIDAASLETGVSEILKASSVDMVFVSCTNVRLMNAVAGIEKSTGVPVTSSNHAMAWHALRLAGDQSDRPELGRLFTKGLAS